MTASCFYEGTVRHRRHAPPVAFSHRLALAYLDLDELPSLLGGRLLRSGFGPLRFRRGDYLGAQGSLDAAIRALVQERIGRRPGGPIRLLTQVRSFGIVFNPVSFYYCFTPGGEQLEAVVAEVTNTPWGERHAYVIDAGATPDRPVVRGGFDKALHVSPFFGMDHAYAFRASVPADTLSVHIESTRDGEPAFEATLALRRRELTPAAARRLAVRYPLASVRVLALIYAHALQLKLRGARYFAPPARRSSPA